MKKSIVWLGIASAELMLLGCLFKIMHWPGAGVFLILSIFTFCFAFLPLALKESYNKQRKNGFLHGVTFVVFFVMMMGLLFKIQHWPGAAIFLLIGIPMPFVIFLPVYLYQTRHENKLNNINFAGIMFGLIFLAVFSVLLSLNISSKMLTGISDTMMRNDSLSDLLQIEKSISHSDSSGEKADKLCKNIIAFRQQLLVQSGNIGNAKGRLESSKELNDPDDFKSVRQVIYQGQGNRLEDVRLLIEEYRREVLADLNNSAELKILAKDLFDTDAVSDDTENWEQKNFPALHLVIVLEALSRIECNVMLVESERAMQQAQQIGY